MDAIIAADLTEARKLLRALNALLDLPKKGRPMTNGRVTISDTPGPGWTTAATSLVEHPTDRRVALLMPPEVIRWAQSARNQKLRPTDKTDLAAALGRVEALSEDWLGDVLDRDGKPTGEKAMKRRTDITPLP